MSRKFCWLAFALAMLVQASSAQAATTYGSYVSGLYKSIVVANADQSEINVVAGLAFDPSHTAGNGDYDRLYLVNRSAANGQRGLYSVDIVNETASSRLALAGDSSNDLDSPAGLVVDTAGSAYVSYGASPSIWKVVDPSGTPVETQLLGNYGDTGDDDPGGLALVPNGFGGGFDSGVDVVLFDTGLDVNENEAVSVIDSLSTAATPLATVLFNDMGGANDDSPRGDSSSVDGAIYFTRLNVETADLGGTVRPYLNRLDSGGNLDRVFLNVEASAFSLALDDAFKINPFDGSAWLPVNDSSEKKFYRVDVANAVNQGGGDFLADVSLEIHLTDSDVYNIGVDSLAFSPDGKYLAVGGPDGQDTIYVYNLTVPEPASVVLLSLAVVLSTSRIHARPSRVIPLA